MPLVQLISELRSFNDFGSVTQITEANAPEAAEVPIFVNEFWTAKQRAGHSLHEISYRACYKPQLPDFFISRLCQPGDLVYDPFMGRGTTLIQAALRGCRSAGNDINPLAPILCAPRLNPPSLEEITHRLADIPLSQEPLGDDELLVFFHPATLGEIQSWQRYFHQRNAAGTFDSVDAWLQMVCLNRLTGHSPGFFSVYTLPPNQAASVASQRLINEKRGQTPEYRDTKKILHKKSKQLLKDPLPPGHTREAPILSVASADATPLIPDNRATLIVTSPPFLDVVNYVLDNWMRQWFAEVSFAPGALWQCRKIADWSQRMAGSLAECHRILQPGGVLAFEVGEVRHGQVKLELEVIRAAAGTGLIPEAIMINAQEFTKTANCWGVDNNAAGTNSNRIVLFRKPGSGPARLPSKAVPAKAVSAPTPRGRKASAVKHQQEELNFS